MGAGPPASAPGGATNGGGLACDVVATISHELRQPLASIRGFTEMLLAHWGDFAEVDKIAMLKEVLHDAMRVGRLVDELLDLSRLESSQLVLHFRLTDLGRLVSRAITNLKVSFPALEATVELPAGAPKVEVDPFKLEQVLTNIVENACKYGSPSSVLIRGSLRGPKERGVVELSVTDRGPGIAPGELPHVTEKFFRSAAAKSNGLGLGLWISKGIVEAHGGKLLASSVPGEGTTVSFTVPCRQKPAKSEASTAGPGRMSRRPSPGTGKLAR